MKFRKIAIEEFGKLKYCFQTMKICGLNIKRKD